MGHLEDPSLTSDLTVARLRPGMTGPPLFISMDFIAGGMVEMIGGLAAAAVLFAYTWWAPILSQARGSPRSGCCARAASGSTATPEVRAAARRRLHIPDGRRSPAKELRLFGLVGWTIDRFVERRTRLHALQHDCQRLREQPMRWSLLIVLGANVLVFWSLAAAVTGGRISLAEVVAFTQAAVGVSLLAFGGFTWALDGAGASGRRAAPQRYMAAAGALPSARGLPMVCPRARSGSAISRSPIRRLAGARALRSDDPRRIVARIVGQNGAARRRSPSCCAASTTCRVAPSRRRRRLREIDPNVARAATAVFQDFIRLELPLRDNVAPSGAPDDTVRAALESAGATGSPSSTRSWPAATRAAPTCRAAMAACGAARGARSEPAPAWCCSTSRRRSSTCAARPRSSSAFWRRRVTRRRS
jgi:ATP-binding cassette subfamily C protein